MKRMNPDFARRDGRTTDYNYGNLIYRTALYFCWTTKWTSYVNTSKANYAMVALSLEMYLVSYNAYHTRKGTVGYTPINCKWKADYPTGYVYSVGESSENYSNATASNVLVSDENNMYVKSEQVWWLTTPSQYNFQLYMCTVDGNNFGLGYGNCYNDFLGRCILTLLNSSFVPILEE